MMKEMVGDLKILYNTIIIKYYSVLLQATILVDDFLKYPSGGDRLVYASCLMYTILYFQAEQTRAAVLSLYKLVVYY